MRALDRLISFIFSIIMLVLSIVLILVGTGVVESQMIVDLLNEYVFINEILESGIFNTLTIIGIVLLLTALKTTVFLSIFKTKDKSPILVKTKDGEVEIAQETITGTVKNVGLSFDNIKDVQAKMLKKRKGVAIYAMVLVYAETNIRETTEEMQRQVKDVIKTTTGVDVVEVNIKVKNVYQKQKKTEELKKTDKEEETLVTVHMEENNKKELETKETSSEEVSLDGQINIEEAQNEK